MQLTIIIGLIVIAVLFWLFRVRQKKQHSNRLLRTPLLESQITLLEQQVPLYRRLPKHHQTTLQGCIHLFLDEKVFVGCEGLVVTDDMRLVIAANACFLLLNREQKHFPGFETILVYPEAYVAKQIRYDGLVEVHEDSARAGESWFRGPVVLSLADVMRGSSNERDGHNVVMHEFAHKLDEESGKVNGMPVLRENAHYKEWAEVLTEEYQSFLDRVERGRNKVIDEYGAVSAPEFFAVATESFFEKSKQMKKRLPDLYQQLQTYYGIDPAEW